MTCQYLTSGGKFVVRKAVVKIPLLSLALL